jgi:hypothetical protein
MKYRIVALAAGLVLGASAPAAAQTSQTPAPVQKIIIKGSAPAVAPAPGRTAAAAALVKAPFGCDAASPNVCHFRIYSGRFSRNVVLPAGMKVAVPQMRIGADTYCVEVNKVPAPKCARKAINVKYNS